MKTQGTHGNIRLGLVTGLVAAAAGAWGLREAGRFLVVEDPFERADVAVVLAGGPTSRALGASGLYREGRVRELLVMPEPPNAVEGEVVPPAVLQELVRLGLVDPHRPQWAQRILAATGVPPSAVTVLPEAVNGTINEAERVHAFLEGRMPQRLVVVTSRSHSRRAQLIYRRVFRRDGVQVLSSPTPHGAFEADRWWSQPRNALTVLTEYQKLLVNVLTLLLRPSG